MFNKLIDERRDEILELSTQKKQLKNRIIARVKKRMKKVLVILMMYLAF